MALATRRSIKFRWCFNLVAVNAFYVIKEMERLAANKQTNKQYVKMNRKIMIFPGSPVDAGSFD